MYREMDALKIYFSKNEIFILTEEFTDDVQ